MAPVIYLGQFDPKKVKLFQIRSNLAQLMLNQIFNIFSKGQLFLCAKIILHNKPKVIDAINLFMSGLFFCEVRAE